MSRSRSSRALRRAGASALIVGLVSSLFVSVAPVAFADPAPMGNFEIDGNLTTEDAGLIDWDTAGSDSRITEFKTFGDDGASYLDSAKEHDPSTWACAANEAPPKDDILRLYLATQISTANQYLHVGYVRASGTGDTDINVEFNRKSSQLDCSIPHAANYHRTAGDFMISFTFPGGDGAAEVSAYEWVPESPGIPNDFVPEDGHWNLLDEPAVLGATNSGEVDDALNGDETLDPRTFGELTIDLHHFFEEGLLSCPGAGYVTPHSRASHDFASDLKDILPERPFDLSDCGSLKLKKVDDAGNAMEGVGFGLFENDGTTEDPVAGDPVQVSGTDVTCETDASGICSMPKVPDGTWVLAETFMPAGYDPDPDLPMLVTIAQFTLLDLRSTPFENPRRVGSVVITKTLTDKDGNRIDITDLNKNFYSPYISGVSFALKQGGATASKRDGNPATCSTGAIDLATDRATCTINLVLFGTYTLHENVPAGTDLPASQQDRTVVVDGDHTSVSVSFTNILNPDILVVKATDTEAVNAGDEVRYTLTVSNAGEAPALDVVLTDTLNGNVSGWTSDHNPPCSIVSGVLTCNVGRLDRGASFAVTVSGIATPAACPRITNQAFVSASNEGEEDRSNNNSTIVPITVNCPDVTISKSTSTASVDAGDAVKFSIVVTNQGAGLAKNVSFSDDLPDGVTWSFDGAQPAGCSLNGSNNLGCSWATLAAGASVVINVKGTADAGDCPSLTNPVITLSASNEAGSATGNNSTGPVGITVNCPSVKVEKAGNGPINAGDVAVYTITVRNIGLGEATDVHVTDTLPAGVTWTAGAGFPSSACSLTGGVLDCTFPSVAAGGSISITVQGTTDAADCPSIRNLLVSAIPSNGQGDTAGPADIVVNCPDMRVTKVGNGPISGGDPDHPAQYTITVTNDGPGVAKNVSFVDHLPAGLSWSAGTPFPAGTCSLVDGTLSCSWASFAPGSVTIVVQAITSDANCPSIQNPISTVTASNEAAGTLGNNSTGPVDIVINCPDLGMSKAADAGSVSRGDPIGFSMKVWNTGPGTSFGTTLSDPLPAGFNWDFSAAGSTQGASCSVDDTTNTLTCDLGTLAAGSSEEEPAAVVHVVAVNTLPAACGPYENTASVVSENGGSAHDSASVTLLCPGVNIAKDADADLVDAGASIGFTLEVSNAGPGEAKDVVVTDVLPGSFAWGVDMAGSDFPEGAECAVTDGVLTCHLGNIAAGDGAAATIHIVATTSVPTGNNGTGECGPYSNVASATPTNGEGAVSGIVNIEVRCPLAIDLTKSGPALAHVGDTVVYQFTVTNTGYVDLVDVQLADPICDIGSPILMSKGDGDSLLEIDTSSEPGLQREVWTYQCSRVVRATDPDPLPNVATVTGTDADQRTTTDTANWLVDLIHPAISIVKTANPEAVSVSGPVTYTYVVTNTGDTALFNLLVTDDILGAIGTLGQLLPGESVTMTKTVQVDASTPPRNIGTAVGTDVLGQSVSANDDAVITVVLAAAAELPRTGAPLDAQTRAAFALLEVGVFMILTGRRRRGDRRAD